MARRVLYRRRKAYIRGALRIFENKLPPKIVISIAEKGGGGGARLIFGRIKLL